MLRRWHAHLGDETLPDVDELRGVNGTEFKRRHYGTLDVRGNREVLPIVLEDHGLYPWRVQLIGEGDSELVALRVLVEHMTGQSFEALGISVTDMGGADIPAKAERILTSMRSYANYFLLVFDNEGSATELVTTLERAQVIEGVSHRQRAEVLKRAHDAIAGRRFEDRAAQRAALDEARARFERELEEPGAAPEFLLWKKNLEADNFSLDEMCAVVNAHAREQPGLDEFELTPAEVQAELDVDEQKPENDRHDVASVIVDLAEAKVPPP